MQRFCHNTFIESFSTTIGVDFQVKTINIDGRIIALQLWDTVKLKTYVASHSYAFWFQVFLFEFFSTKAGQERYRSITKQYFRKADGVICMYDVTSEQSFKNLRNWITSMKVKYKRKVLKLILSCIHYKITFLKESADENCMLTIIGNKIDLCETEDSRVIKYKNGSTLADVNLINFNLIFKIFFHLIFYNSYNCLKFKKEHSALFFETSSREGKYVIETIEAIARILQEKEDKQIEDVLNLKTKEKKGRCCS